MAPIIYAVECAAAVAGVLLLSTLVSLAILIRAYGNRVRQARGMGSLPSGPQVQSRRRATMSRRFRPETPGPPLVERTPLIFDTVTWAQQRVAGVTARCACWREDPRSETC